MGRTLEHELHTNERINSEQTKHKLENLHPFFFMHCSHCGVCCHETAMLLSEEDISRLEKAGYSPNRFFKFDRQGYAKLRNTQGYCYFYDAKKRRCRAYRLRPHGCRLYPVISEAEDTIILDELCPTRNTVTKKEMEAKGKGVLKLLKVIDKEAAKRKAAEKVKTFV
jgi:Fe-S-cluster containining protein